MAHANPVAKLYKSIIEDVIEGVQELFAEEGLEEQVLQDLKQRWETKVLQSKATEGFFKNSHNSQRFSLQLPQNLHHVLQASTASFVIPPAKGFQHFTAIDPGASRAGATLIHPSGIAYPVHVPAGVMLQTASGHLFKVNVPVVVTQTTGDVSILHHPVQQIYQPLGQPSILPANVASVAQVSDVTCEKCTASSEISQPQDAAVQHTMFLQPNVTEKNNLESSANTSLVQHPSVSQQQLPTDAALNQCADSTEKSQHESLHTAVFTPESSKGFSPAKSLANNSSSVLLDAEEQLDIQLQESVHQQVSDDIIDLIIMGNSVNDGTVLKDQDTTASSDKVESTVQMESNLQSEKDICSDIEGIIQLDGTGDASPKKEIPHTKDKEENKFIGVVESEDLKVQDDEDDEECGSTSDTESSSSGDDNEEPQIDIVEEDPLNSGDDISEQDIPDLFDTNNLIVCQYDKIHRSKNKWKFYLKDGVMSFDGKDHIFSKAIGDAEW